MPPSPPFRGTISTTIDTLILSDTGSYLIVSNSISGSPSLVEPRNFQTLATMKLDHSPPVFGVNIGDCPLPSNSGKKEGL